MIVVLLLITIKYTYYNFLKMCIFMSITFRKEIKNLKPYESNKSLEDVKRE